MNIRRAKQEIRDTIEAYLIKDEYGSYVIPPVHQRPILLIGPPGVGKTQIMEQISQECQIGLVSYTITHHTRQSAIGLPLIEKREYNGQEYAATEYTMSEIVASVYEKIQKTGLAEGILFIDEINCVSETLAPAMLQFLQGKTFGCHKIPEGWIIVAAGNPPEYNKSVREFDIVTLDRIRNITVEPDLDAWMEYAAAADVHPAIRAYLNIRKQNFCRIETTVDGKRFATPRGWEDLSRLIRVYEKLKKPVDRELVEEYIQFPQIARDFANYLSLYYKYRDDYRVDEILAGRIPAGACEKLEKAAFDERISAVSLLLSGLTEGFRQVCRMEDEMSLRMRLLREWKNEGELTGERYLACAEGFRREWEKRQENGLLSPADLSCRRAVSEAFERDLQRLQKDDSFLAEPVWEKLRGFFAADSDLYEETVSRTGEKLEHAFDFMEAAFGTGQETVLFVTELNTGLYSVRFLQEYECERYYQYNKSLLFSEEALDIERILAGRK